MLANNPNQTNCSLGCCSPGVYVFIVVIMVLLIVAILYGNTIVLAVLLRTKHFHSPQGFLKISLAVADLALGILVVPFSVYVEVSILFTNTSLLDWAKGVSLEGSWHPCNVIGPIFAGCTLVSITTIFLLTTERSIAIFKPLHKESLITRGRTLLLILLSWLTCFFLALAPVIFSQGGIVMEYDYCSRMCIYAPASPTYDWHILLLFPAFDFSLLAGTLLMNALCLATIRKYTRRRRLLAEKGHRLPRLSFSDIKAAKTIGALTILFAASFSPVAVFVVGNVLGYKWCTFSFLAFWILASNSCCNVILYSVTDQHFRRGAIKMLLFTRGLFPSHYSTNPSLEPSIPDMGNSKLWRYRQAV